MRTDAPRAAAGLGALDSDRFDAAAAVGGWRGALESAGPALVFVIILAVAPTALPTALTASLVVSAVALLARLAQSSRRRSLRQVAGGALVAGVSAAWAWRSGRASDFYATGLVINAVWLVICLGSLLVRRPIVGVLMELWRSTSATADGGRGTGDRGRRRTDPDPAGTRRRYVIGTGVLTAMFMLRLLVEVPLYLVGEAAVGALGVARIVLGLPLFALCLWFVWLIVRPAPGRLRPDEGRERR